MALFDNASELNLKVQDDWRSCQVNIDFRNGGISIDALKLSKAYLSVLYSRLSINIAF